MKSLVADKSVVSLMGVEREEDPTHCFPPFSKISMEKNLVDAVETVGRLIQNLKQNTDKRRKRKLNNSVN